MKKVDSKKIEPSLPFVYSWQSQAEQYPDTGEVGISYFKGDVGRDKWVDCLLYRGEGGELMGILNYYPFDFPPYEVKGNVNIWVNPDFQRLGIGTKLVEEAMKRWEIDFEQFKYTPQGHKFVISFLKSKNLLKNG
jgi:GNAT superfamily N-acetyltransferase